MLNTTSVMSDTYIVLVNYRKVKYYYTGLAHNEDNNETTPNNRRSRFRRIKATTRCEYQLRFCDTCPAITSALKWLTATLAGNGISRRSAMSLKLCLLRQWVMESGYAVDSVALHCWLWISLTSRLKAGGEW